MTSKQMPAAKPPCKIHNTAIIAEKAQLTGTYLIEIGEGVVLHPYCKIRAEGGKVTIGKNTMVYERATIGCAQGAEMQDIFMGDDVNIETSAIVEGSIGDGSTVEVSAMVGRGAAVGKYCKIAPLERVEAGETLEDYTVVYSDGKRRIDKTMEEHEEVREAKRVGQEKAVEVMRKMIPNAAAKWM